MQHTPGPWTVSIDTHQHPCLVISSDDLRVAKISWANAADARLIAAAPDLLAALSAMLENWEFGGLKPYPIAQVRAAIAKATT